MTANYLFIHLLNGDPVFLSLCAWDILVILASLVTLGMIQSQHR